MARALLCLVAVAASAVASAQPPARDNPPPVGTAAIRGRVIAAVTDRPLPRVEVRAVSAPLRVNKPVMTDADGRYEITDLPAGKYTIAALKPNYVRAVWGQQRPLGPGQPVEIAEGRTTSRIDFALQRSGVITGRIIDEYGDPVTDTQVVPMRYAFINGERRLQAAGMFSSTDDLGEFRVFGLPPGQYILGATIRNQNFGSTTDQRSAYVPTFYPGTANPADAQRLTVAPGQTIPGINLTLLPVTAARVSGVVLDMQGRPLSGGFVNLTARTAVMPFGPGAGAPIMPNGTFRVDGVAPGEYTIRANPGGPMGPTGPDEFATMDLTVSGGDVSDLQLVVTKPSVLRGRLVFEPGTVAPPVATAVRLTATSATRMPGPTAMTNAKADGTFEMKAGAGHVTIRLAVSPAIGDWRLKRVLVGDADVIDTGLDVPPNATIDNLVLELTTRRAEIAASVSDASGAAVRDCVVVLFARDPSRWVPQTRYFSVGRPDTEGVYHSRPPAGDYFVAAFEETEQNIGIFADPEILMQLRDRATPITLPEGDITKIQVKLTEPPVY